MTVLTYLNVPYPDICLIRCLALPVPLMERKKGEEILIAKLDVVSLTSSGHAL